MPELLEQYHQLMPAGPWYAFTMAGGLIMSVLLWSRFSHPQPRMLGVYIGALVGAFLGAKLGYLIAECPWLIHDTNGLLKILVGKTLLGALLGGYAGVELAKKILHIHETGGDRFALIVPISVALGRIGCLLHGCCLGVSCHPAWYTLESRASTHHLPAAAIELLFNLAAASVLYLLWRNRRYQGQLFYLYLIAYGLFRFALEPWRATPKFAGEFFQTLGPYQILGLIRLLYPRFPI